jgi:hypothetical protein
MGETHLGLASLVVVAISTRLWIRALKRVEIPKNRGGFAAAWVVAAGLGVAALAGEPMSLLVDANGKVLWMDQSENYQRRSNPDYVLAALRQHLD